jgi:Protein of unknown function (DUF2914)
MNLQHIACALALALGNAAVLTAQDSTAAPVPTPAAASSLTVTEAVIAKAVVDRAPQEPGTTFAADVGQVVCFTKVSGASGEETIHHVWFHGADQVGDVELKVAGSPWRTYSRKTVPIEATGAWHVEIRDGSGNLLQRVDFTVGE